MKQYDYFPPFIHKRRNRKYTDEVLVVLWNGVSTIGFFEKKKNDKIRFWDIVTEIPVENIISWSKYE